jgi:hypothetical protein
MGCPACASADRRAAGASRRSGRIDYTTIAPGALGDALARHALELARRRRPLARTRAS